MVSDYKVKNPEGEYTASVVRLKEGRVWSGVASGGN